MKNEIDMTDIEEVYKCIKDNFSIVTIKLTIIA